MTPMLNYREFGKNGNSIKKLDKCKRKRDLISSRYDDGP